MLATKIGLVTRVTPPLSTRVYGHRVVHIYFLIRKKKNKNHPTNASSAYKRLSVTAHRHQTARV